MKPNHFYYIFFLCSLLLVGGCGLIGNEQGPADFGLEEGYFIYNLDDKKIPWTRNRNYLSIEFYEEVSEEALHVLLDEYDLKYEGQVFPVKHVFARVTTKPAEKYYTTYGDSTQPVLGNRAEVQYALPVFMNEFDEPVMITNNITVRFDGLNEEQELAIIDSLIAADNLTRAEDGPGSPTRYRLLVNKHSPDDPYSLANKYHLIDGVRYATLNTAFQISSHSSQTQ